MEAHRPLGWSTRLVILAVAIALALALATPAGAAFKPIAEWGSPDPGELILPIDVERDDAGNTYVVDALGASVTKFDAANNPILSWGSSGSGLGEFALPISIGVNEATGQAYVADVDESSQRIRIQRFDSNGNPLGEFGGLGTAEGQFDGLVHGIAVNSGTGDVYVAENERVQRFSSTGQFELMWGRDVDPGGGTGFEICAAGCKEGEFGAAAGELGGAEGIATVGNWVFVSESANRRVSRYNATTGAFQVMAGLRRRSGRGDGRGDMRRGLPGRAERLRTRGAQRAPGPRRQPRHRAPVHRRPGKRPGAALEHRRARIPDRVRLRRRRGRPVRRRRGAGREPGPADGHRPEPAPGAELRRQRRLPGLVRHPGAGDAGVPAGDRGRGRRRLRDRLARPRAAIRSERRLHRAVRRRGIRPARRCRGRRGWDTSMSPTSTTTACRGSTRAGRCSTSGARPASRTVSSARRSTSRWDRAAASTRSRPAATACSGSDRPAPSRASGEARATLRARCPTPRASAPTPTATSTSPIPAMTGSRSSARRAAC